MDIGAHGHLGHLVLNHAVQVSKRRQENATDRKLNMAAGHAQDIVQLMHTAT